MLSLDELRSCGLNSKAVESRIRNGHLHPLYRGVYAVGHTRLSLEGHFLAAVKAYGPTAALSHYSAAALYGLVRWDHRDPEVRPRSSGDSRAFASTGRQRSTTPGTKASR